MDLLEELAEVHSALVVHESFLDECRTIPSLDESKAEVNILPKAHRFIESSKLQVDGAATTEVEATRLELLHPVSASTTDPSSRQGRGHRIVDSLLYRGKVVRCSIRPAEGIYGVLLQVVVYCSEIAWGQDDIRVKDDKVLARGFSSSEVTCS